MARAHADVPTEDFTIGASIGIGIALAFGQTVANRPAGALRLGSPDNVQFLAVCGAAGVPLAIGLDVIGRALRKDPRIVTSATLVGLSAASLVAVVAYPELYGPQTLPVRRSLAGVAVCVMWVVACTRIASFVLYEKDHRTVGPSSPSTR
jgi:hypothetical protein